MDFLLQYKELIIVVASALIEIILILIFKKRPQVVDNSIMVKLCDWILHAESIYKHGNDKLHYVLGEAEKYLGDKYREKDIRPLIEYILSVPEKKEK